jgi:hypothetical protein
MIWQPLDPVAASLLHGARQTFRDARPLPWLAAYLAGKLRRAWAGG